jgi:hypothetical protein
MENKQPEQTNIPIKITDSMSEGRYANQMMIRHTAEEFVLDFFNFFPGDPQAVVTGRVVMTPGHLKRMISALNENLKKYEAQFGNVTPSENIEPKMGFRTE